MSVGVGTLLGRNNEILYAPAGADQAVMMSVAEGSYFGLNATAKRIWELLERPQTIAELSAQLCQEFDVEAQTCTSETLVFAQELVDNGIIHEVVAQD
jgi:hypothetical protein